MRHRVLNSAANKFLVVNRTMSRRQCSDLKRRTRAAEGPAAGIWGVAAVGLVAAGEAGEAMAVAVWG